MQASIIEELLSEQYFADKLERLVSDSEEMNQASLDASRYKGDVREFLENLSQDEFVKMLGTIIKEVQGRDGCLQDSENQDATNRGRHNLKDVTREEKKVPVEASGNQNQPASANVRNVCPQDLENQDASVTSHHVLKDVSTEKEKVQVEYQDQQATDHAVNEYPQDLEAADTGHYGREVLKDDLSTHNIASNGQDKQRRRKPSCELPSPQQSPTLIEQKVSDQQQCLESPHNDENQKIPISSRQRNDPVSTNSSAERLTDSESDEELMSDSNSSSTGSSSANCDSHPGSTVPIQAYADNNRAISPHAIEHPQTSNSVPGSRSGDGNSVPRDSHRSRVEDAQDQLPEQPNPQRPWLESCNVQLTETLRNYSQVALQQANRETQNVQGTTCSNCDAMQEENDELQEQVVNLEEEFQQSQEQIAAYGPLLRDQAHQINILKQQCDQLLTEIASYEETVRAQHEDKKDDKMMIDFLIERNKKWQDEHDIANKRAGKFAQKSEEEFDALQKTMQDITKGIEELQKKLMAEKEEKEMLKKKLKEWEERWKEMDRNLGQGNMHQHRELRALQRRLGLRFCAGDEEGNNLNPQQDDVDEVD